MKIIEEGMIDIQKLQPHPRNKEIYGEEDIKELADKIRQTEVVTPVLIDTMNIIISGHRRTYACIYNQMTEIPYRRAKFDSEDEELERLLIENQYREKTMTQKAQEGKMWEEIEIRKAKERQLSGLKNQNVVKDNSPTRENGQSRDIIAEKVGIGSGRTYERAKNAVNKIDELKKENRTKDAEFLTAVLNDSVRGAKDLSENNIINKIPEDIKEKVIKKEIPVQKAVSKIRKDLGIVTDNMKKTKKQKQETKICKQCGKEKSILEFYDGKNLCKDCCNENTSNKRKPKDIYGNTINIDKEKLKGIDINAIIADVKDTNKSIDTFDYDSLSMEFTSNINMFVQNINKYTNDCYKLKDIDKNNKDEILKSIDYIENTINKIKNILI